MYEEPSFIRIQCRNEDFAATLRSFGHTKNKKKP